VLVRVGKATGSAVAGITLFGVVLLASGSTSLGVGARAAAAAPRPARLPLDFVANRGQWSQDVRYAARRGPLSATFGRHSFALGLPGGRITLQFDRARHGSRLVGVGSRSARYSFFIGSDPTRWRSNVRAYSSLLYRDLYPGVDVRVHEGPSRLEYDLVAAPHGALGRLAIRVGGARAIVGSDGSLLLRTRAGTVRQAPPIAWQILPDGRKRAVVASYRLLGRDRYGFSVPARDAALPLVIDPGLDWATFLGGNGDDSIEALRVAKDGSGDVIVAGQTWSPDFPHQGGVGNLAPVGGTPYVARLDATGATVKYVTYFGGTYNHSVKAVALDANSAPVVVGDTNSIDFPTTPGAYDRTPPDGFTGDYDAYVIKFNATGSAIGFGTYLGGSPSSANLDQAWAVGVDPTGSTVVAGITTSNDFPTTAGALDRTRNGRDIFISRLDPAGSNLTYSTFFGGDTYDEVFAMAVDSQGFVDITGKVSSGPASTVPFPTTADAFDRTFDGTADAFVARLKLDGAGAADLKYSTLLGGNQYTEAGDGIAFDPNAPTSVTVSGFTRSGDFPTTVGALQRTHFAPVDTTMGFVTRFTFPAGGPGAIVWSTLYGGPGNQTADDVTVDSSGNAIIVGGTAANNPPTTDGSYDRIPGKPYGEGPFNGLADAYVARISADGSRLLYSTLIGGGDADDFATRIGYLGGTSVVISGGTRSPDFPVTAGAADRVYAADGLPSGGATLGTNAFDGFVAKLTLAAPAGGDTTPPPAPTLAGPADGSTFGTASGAVTLDWGDVSDPSGIAAYHVQISPNSTFTDNFDAELAGWFEPWERTSLAAKVPGSTPGTWYWRVQALDGANNLGPWSVVRTFNVASSPPPGSSGLALDVQLNPTTVFGAGTSTGTVVLAAPAPAGGATVQLASTIPSRASVPPSVTVPAGATTASFPVTTSNGNQQVTIVISGSYAGSTQGAILIAYGEQARELNGLTVSTNQPLGGASVQATVSLIPGWVAPPGGAIVTLGSSNPARASVPPSVAIPAGANSATFTITTTAVSSATDVTILAARSITQRQTLTLLPPGALDTLTLNPSTVTGGDPSQGTVTLSSAAPAGGVVVALSSSNTSVATVPASVTVPAGATSTSFTVSTSVVTGGGTWSSITASAGGLQRSTTLNVNPAPPGPGLSTFTLAPTSVTGGSNSTGTVTLTGSVSACCAVVQLSSSNPGVASVPASVVVPVGSSQTTFTVTTSSVTASTPVTITASRGATRTASLTVNPPGPVTPALSSVAVSPSTVTGGASSTGTVTLTAAAATGGAAVSLASSNTAAATTPASVTVPAGQTSATFTVSTAAVTTSTTVTISAMFGGLTKSAPLTVSPGSPPGALPAPSLLSPSSGAEFAPGRAITFDWSDVTGASSYTIQIDDSSTFSAPLVATQTVTVPQFTTSTLPTTGMWWRVRANDSSGTPGAWSGSRRFEVN
jgi:hypothetical protein